MTIRGRLLALTGVVMAAIVTILSWTAGEADAKASYISPYTLPQTYGAALRLIRVDKGFKIVERDPDAAYIMFEYVSAESGKRITPGAIEMIPGKDSVTVQVKLHQMPRYHEDVMADALKRKLRSEYGDPPPKRRPKPQPPKPPDTPLEAGTDAAR